VPHDPAPTPARAARPLQNRVDPFGALIADPARGTLMGNRGGRLHRADQTLGARRWTSRRWIACVCDFKGRKRAVWGEGYTELFFLDEPTALAAGHRPCFECRRAEAEAFREAFPGGPRLGADAIDAALHDERLEGRRKRLWRADLAELPDNTMIARGGPALLVSGDALLPWDLRGYGAPQPRRGSEAVDVLTPRSIAAALRAGYRPRSPQAL